MKKIKKGFTQGKQFHSEFLYYDSVKYSKKIPDFVMRQENVRSHNRREVYLNSTHLQQEQCYNEEMQDLELNFNYHENSPA